MNQPLETRASLLLRVRDPADREAWEEFVEIYGPVVHRLARHKGMQPADADDVTQQVLLAVARAVERRGHDPERARFRTWLGRIARNAILNALTRGKPDRGSGDSDLQELLNEFPSPSGPDSDFVRLECRREQFRRAARQIRPEFHPATWRAFWLTTVEGRGCEEVARELGKQIGSIYAARSRVMKRLQEKVDEIEPEAAAD